MIAVALRSLLVVILIVSLRAPIGAQTIAGETLPDIASEILMEVLAQAGLSSATVTSVNRTPLRQAELMLAAIRRDGVEAVRAVYAAAAHPVIDAYEAALAAGASERTTIAQMEAAVEAVVEELGDDRSTMMHVSSTRHAFDVAPSSIADSAAFVRALRAHPRVLRFIEPGAGEYAFHIEVARMP